MSRPSLGQNIQLGIRVTREDRDLIEWMEKEQGVNISEAVRRIFAGYRSMLGWESSNHTERMLLAALKAVACARGVMARPGDPFYQAEWQSAAKALDDMHGEREDVRRKAMGLPSYAESLTADIARIKDEEAMAEARKAKAWLDAQAKERQAVAPGPEVVEPILPLSTMTPWPAPGEVDVQDIPPPVKHAPLDWDAGPDDGIGLDGRPIRPT